MGRELPPRWVIVVGLGVLAVAAVAIAVNAAFPRKLSAAGTARALHRYTTYRSITCHREAGRFWSGWDYRCQGRVGHACDVLDVEVSRNAVTDQDMPGNCAPRRVSSAFRASGLLTVTMSVVATNWSMPLDLRVLDSGGHRVGEAPLSNNWQGWSFRLRPGAYRAVIADGCLRRVQLRRHAHIWVTVVMHGDGCRIVPAAAPYAGLNRAQALGWARKTVIRERYRGNAALFYRNLGDAQTRRTRNRAGRRSWLVKFYDSQALRSSCVYEWRGSVTWAVVHVVPCAKTALR